MENVDSYFEFFEKKEQKSDIFSYFATKRLISEGKSKFFYHEGTKLHEAFVIDYTRLRGHRFIIYY